MRSAGRWLVWVGLALALAWPGPRASAQDYTEAQRQALSFRAAQVDALGRLADLVASAHLSADQTVGQALERGSDGWIALRLFLRSARPVGEPRYYSTGVAEVDLEIPLEAVLKTLSVLCTRREGDVSALDDLRAKDVDGHLRVSGVGRVPPDLEPVVAAQVVASPPETLPEMYPLGWATVQASGRLQAARDARIRAYGAMSAQVRELRVTPSHTVSDMVGGSAAAEARLDVYLRSLAPAGRPRMMPDGLCEVTVAAPLRDLIAALKEIQAMNPTGPKATGEEMDGLSVRLKTDRLTATGHGAPASAYVREGGGIETVPLPDWAAATLETRGESRPPEHIEDAKEARVLALRAAKATAMEELAKRLDAVGLDDGRTVRERAAKDPVFQRDVKTFLQSAETVASRPTDDGQWEVVVRLPLARLYEFSRRGM